MDIASVYKKRFQARRFKKDNIPSKELINSLLEKAFNLISSKQSLVPYKVIVFGPEHTEIKQKLWEASSWHWENKKPQLDTKPHKATIQLIAPYLILFADREVNDYNPSTKRKVDKGHPYSSLRLYGDVPNKSTEVGMFATLLTGLCLEKNLSISYTTCFPVRTPLQKLIKDDSLLDINLVFLFMSIGYADGHNFSLEEDEYKPPIENIIEWR